ncbi:MAG: FIST C-terminal domain-containing protein [Elusimicrobia bacterium]|nr:FIST C-terminal domain-containing protein [Elusimicrobiota bacterium]
MRIGVGFSQHSDPAALAAEAGDLAMGNAGAVRADFALVFTTAHPIAEYMPLLETVRKVTGAKEIAGASASGIVVPEGEFEDGSGAAIVVFDFEGGAGLIRSALWRAGSKPSLPVLDKKQEPGSLMVLADPAAFDAQTFKGLAQDGRIAMFGAGASGFLKQTGGAPVLHQDQGYRNAAVLIGFSRSMALSLNVAYGCRALSSPFQVTKVRNNLVLELAGRPAAKILEEELTQTIRRLHPNKHWDKPLPLLAGILLADSDNRHPPHPSEFVVRPILGVDPNTGGLLFEEKLQVGRQITFVLREKEWAHREMLHGIESLASQLQGRRPKFGFYFNCAGRGRDLFGEDDHDLKLITERLGAFPLVGMFSSFELVPQGPSLSVHGFTGILAVFI